MAVVRHFWRFSAIYRLEFVVQGVFDDLVMPGPKGTASHEGAFLKQGEVPDHINTISIDIQPLRQGGYDHVGYEKRQVLDLDISIGVSEYRAEVVRDTNKVQFMADFPEGITWSKSQ